MSNRSSAPSVDGPESYFHLQNEIFELEAEIRGLIQKYSRASRTMDFASTAVRERPFVRQIERNLRLLGALKAQRGAEFLREAELRRGLGYVD